MSSEIASTTSTVGRRCGYCCKTGHNIRTCEEKRIAEEKIKKDSGKEKINEMIAEIENYKQESLRKRQIISNLLISNLQLELKNSLLNDMILKLNDEIATSSQATVLNNDNFAVHSMKELIVKAKECCDICYNEFEYDTIVIKSCWHKCCTTCNQHLNKCHVCRQ
jgi:hypothetical protein